MNAQKSYVFCTQDYYDYKAFACATHVPEPFTALRLSILSCGAFTKFSIVKIPSPFSFLSVIDPIPLIFNKWELVVLSVFSSDLKFRVLGPELVASFDWFYRRFLDVIRQLIMFFCGQCN